MISGNPKTILHPSEIASASVPTQGIEKLPIIKATKTPKQIINQLITPNGPEILK